MTEYVGLALDAGAHDLRLDETGALALVRDAHAIGQHVKQRLKFHVGEWFLDTSAGMPWLPRPGQFAILSRPYDAGTSEAVIKAEILDTPGITGIEDFDARVVPGRRDLAIDVSAGTVFDEPVEVRA